MQDEQAAHRLVKGALLITIAGIISKGLSAIYRIPLQNLTGDIGFYTYQQIYPLLGMIIILSLYGFPSAISRIAVQIKEKQQQLSVVQFIFPITLLLLIVNGSIYLLLVMFSTELANFIGDPQLVKVYKKAAFLFLMIPLVALLRGLFQSDLQMQPIAYSQMGEQLIRVLIILFVAILFAQDKLSSVYSIGQGAVYASGGGIIIAILLLVPFLGKLKITWRTSSRIPWKKYSYTILVFGIVASLNHMVLLLLQWADTLTLIPQLQLFGFTKEEAMVAKGIFDRGHPLIQLGTVLGSSFALALIPTVTRESTNTHVSSQATTEAMSLSFYLAVGATVGLILIFPETNLLLFKNLSGTFSLQILSLSIVLSVLSMTGIAILQGLGIVLRPAIFIVLSFMVKWIGNVLFVPLYGITGSALATVLSLFTLVIFVLWELHKKYPLINIVKSIRWKSLGYSTMIMGVVVGIMKGITPNIIIQSRITLLFYVIFTVSFGALSYLYILYRGKALTDTQIDLVPVVRKLFKR